MGTILVFLSRTSCEGEQEYYETLEPMPKGQQIFNKWWVSINTKPHLPLGSEFTFLSSHQREELRNTH